MPDSPDSLIDIALDPARSVVVEACAGSGKTWLLAARIVRLLLADVAPGEILAITFTRKAAREIEERVVDWLRLLATDSEQGVAGFLAERGVSICEVTLRKARALYERVLGAQPPLAVNTFHGWFLQLVAAAPLSANLAGATLVDSDSRLFDEWWQSFAADLQKAPDSDPAASFVALLRQAGLDGTRRLLRRGMARRTEWLAFGAGHGDPLALALDELRARLGVGETASALTEFFAPGWAADYHAYLGWLELSELETDRKLAHKLRLFLSKQIPDCLSFRPPAALPSGLHSPLCAPDGALPAGENPAQSGTCFSANNLLPTLNEGAEDGACFAALREVFLTQKDGVRSRKASKSLDKRFGADGAARFLELHARLGGAIAACVERQIEERVYAFNRDACCVFQAFLAHVDAFKAARRQIDFVDAEWRVLQLLRDEPAAAFLQARLDARYRHVLLDEFQDTNPLQWQILLAWLDAYSDAQRPGIFLVGDPKQSIYRFRRAEPRLFAAAATFLEARFTAARCAQDATRRNARPIIDVVNALFLGRPEFEPFREQRSLAGDLPGRVELLPLCGGETSEDNKFAEQDAEVRDGLRDPLTEPASEPLDLRRQHEAEQLAETIGQRVGTWLIDEPGPTGQATRRPLRYGDIMLLARSRTHLATYERALIAAGIPFAGAARGGLLATLEAGDILALLEFLVTPVADLALARALRSPIFACTDGELLLLAARDEAGWWPRLLALCTEPEPPPRLIRAARLLGEWLSAADRLPAHDLLDRIYHGGEVLARYRLAAPAAARAAVEANLRALLLLSLDLDGGRYPSLPRFIDELNELNDRGVADANDTPDEGAIDSDEGVATADGGRVRILTIHGAKGLESPVVWLLDANAAARGGDSWDVLVDWAPEAPAPRHFSFVGRLPERGAARQPLFEQEAAAATREELNLLYVAITRARQVFIASGIENARSGETTPYRRLQAALEALGGNGDLRYGDNLAQSLTPEPTLPPASPEPAADDPLPRLGERRATPDAAERFGILLHALLERRTGTAATDGWWRALGFDDDEYGKVQPLAERLLTAPALQRFFDPALFRHAWNELDICAANGSPQRIDRLVDSPGTDDALWVLDYKSSRSETSRLAAYRAQVADYCAAVATVFPGRTVRGALIFADGALLEVC